MGLQFSREQMDQLGRDMRERFERDCVRQLRGRQPEQTAKHDDATLLAFVQHGVHRAALARVDRVSDVLAWLELMLRLGPRFDEDARLQAVQRALADAETPAEVRLAEARRLADALLAPQAAAETARPSSALRRP